MPDNYTVRQVVAAFVKGVGSCPANTVERTLDFMSKFGEGGGRVDYDIGVIGGRGHMCVTQARDYSFEVLCAEIERQVAMARTECIAITARALLWDWHAYNLRRQEA